MNIEIITNSIFNSRTYILSDPGRDSVYLVDCGDVDRLMEQVKDRKIEAVLLTHTHFDHIYGLPLIVKRYPDLIIYTNEWGKRALADDRLNMSRYHALPVRLDCRSVQVLKEGDAVCGFDVYETPGHNPSCICYADNCCIFTGDSYIPGCRVVTSLPNSDKKLSEASLFRILTLSEGKSIYPGHTV